jgi:hypothetical protein
MNRDVMGLILVSAIGIAYPVTGMGGPGTARDEARLALPISDSGSRSPGFAEEPDLPPTNHDSETRAFLAPLFLNLAVDGLAKPFFKSIMAEVKKKAAAAGRKLVTADPGDGVETIDMNITADDTDEDGDGDVFHVHAELEDHDGDGEGDNIVEEVTDDDGDDGDDLRDLLAAVGRTMDKQLSALKTFGH